MLCEFYAEGHTWKSCNRQKRFEGSNPSFSANVKTLAALRFSYSGKGFTCFLTSISKPKTARGSMFFDVKMISNSNVKSWNN